MWNYSKSLVRRINNLLHSSEFLRFFIAGGSAFLTDLIVLQFLIRIVGFNPQVIGTLSGANIISSTIGMVISFYLNRNWSFKANQDKISGQGIRFLIVQAFSWFLNNLLFGVATLQLGVNVTLAKIAVTFLQMIWNFFLYKLFVFKSSSK